MRGGWRTEEREQGGKEGGQMKKEIHRKVLKSGAAYFMIRPWNLSMAVNQE